MDIISIPGRDIQGGSVGVFWSLNTGALNSFAWSDTAFVRPCANDNKQIYIMVLPHIIFKSISFNSCFGYSPIPYIQWPITSVPRNKQRLGSTWVQTELFCPSYLLLLFSKGSVSMFYCSWLNASSVSRSQWIVRMTRSDLDSFLRMTSTNKQKENLHSSSYWTYTKQ